MTPSPKTASHFDICKLMCERDLDIQMAPMSNISHLQKIKAGTKVTIGIAGDMVGAIAKGDYCGGLILCNTEQYQEALHTVSTRNPCNHLSGIDGECLVWPPCIGCIAREALKKAGRL